MEIWIKRIFWTVVSLAIVIQVVRPSHENPAVAPDQTIQAVMPVPLAAQSILDRSCNDCHSSRTVWPWYSQVAPASWLVATDVRSGQKAMNFSEWAKYSPQHRQELLKDTCDEASQGKMPEGPYLLLHPNARLTDADRWTLCAWTLQGTGAGRN